ncbi:MAG: ATP synthase F1 subunit gamma [Phycisphaerales bacterium]|nr:ATP synthase F1 subunit gamma [Phycisphaerales bacterium]
MAQIREIKKRMVAVRTIQRITKTMQMIATAKFTGAQARARGTRPYTQKIRQLCAEVAAAAGDVEHPLLAARTNAGKRELLLVISADRGLCGAYNSSVLRTSLSHIRSQIKQSREVVLETAGKKAIGFFKFQKVAILQKHSLGDKPTFAGVSALAEQYIKAFTAGEYDSVKIVFMRFITVSRQAPEVMQLLPLSNPTTAGSAPHAAALYDFSPDAGELLRDLLPRSVKVALYQAFMDAIVSENVMRMVAMKAATDNAGGLGRTLKRNYNRARQARITTELTEIVSGAAALG